jgi:hypothetical protein
MSDPYTSFYLDAKQARHRPVPFQSRPDRHADSLSPLITKSAPVANDPKEAAKRPSLSQELSRLRKGLNDVAKSVTPPNRSGSRRDMSAFSFCLTLLLLGTIAAANTNHPVFWLLIGPAPLAAGFMVLQFFRKRFGWRSPFVVFGKRDDNRSALRTPSRGANGKTSKTIADPSRLNSRAPSPSSRADDDSRTLALEFAKI